MSFYRLIRPVLFLLPPEFAHGLSVKVLALLGKFRPRPAQDDYSLKTKALGLVFPNPFGFAAGFDKNGEAVNGVLKIGFGFAEIGTVTPKAQAGNPRPRLFRLVAQEALINRLGFNNQGHEAVHKRLVNNSPIGIVGVNIGANKDAKDPIADYEAGAICFADLANYLTLNISSPNTPHLRDLQKPAALSALIKRVKKAAPNVPILLKIAPDLEYADLASIASVAMKARVDGLIVANTSIERSTIADSPYAAQTGGLSGRPLMDKSTQILATMRYLTQGKLLLIASGGVANAADAYAKIRAGASLVQLYTALVYQGPGLAKKLKRDLVDLLRQDGLESVMDAIGADMAARMDDKQSTKKPTAISPKQPRKKPAQTKGSKPTKTSKPAKTSKQAKANKPTKTSKPAKPRKKTKSKQTSKGK